MPRREFGHATKAQQQQLDEQADAIESQRRTIENLRDSLGLLAERLEALETADSK